MSRPVLTTQELIQGVENTIDLIHRTRSSLVGDIEFEIKKDSISFTRPRSFLEMLRGRPKEIQRVAFTLQVSFTDRHGLRYAESSQIDAPVDTVKIQNFVYQKCVEWLNDFWSDSLHILPSEGEKVRKIIDSIANTGLLRFVIEPLRADRVDYVKVRSYDIVTDELSHLTYHLPLFFIRDYKKFIMEHRIQSPKGHTSSTPTTT